MSYALHTFNCKRIVTMRSHFRFALNALTREWEELWAPTLYYIDALMPARSFVTRVCDRCSLLLFRVHILYRIKCGIVSVFCIQTKTVYPFYFDNSTFARRWSIPPLHTGREWFGLNRLKIAIRLSSLFFAITFIHYP